MIPYKGLAFRCRCGGASSSHGDALPLLVALLLLLLTAGAWAMPGSTSVVVQERLPSPGQPVFLPSHPSPQPPSPPPPPPPPPPSVASPPAYGGDPEQDTWQAPPEEDVERSPFMPFPPEQPPSPLPPPPAPTMAATDSPIVAAGSSHTCVAMYGKVKCFGMNVDGRLGLGNNLTHGAAPGTMGAALPFVDLGTGLEAVALAAGSAHTCAILNPGGGVKCWGKNAAGQLGLGDNVTRGLRPSDMGDNLPFVDLGPGLSAVAIVAGSRHTCALLHPVNKVKCWGSNLNGRLGLGDSRPRGLMPSDMGANLTFVDLGPGLNVTALAAGAEHTCALLLPGPQVKCWGRNNHGQLGLGDRVPRGVLAGQMGTRLRSVDFGPDGLRTPAAITTGAAHTCALLAPGGGVRCWGSNIYGQLNLGDNIPRGDKPGQTSAYFQDARLGRTESAVAVAAGVTFTCALLQDTGSSRDAIAVAGRPYVKCWGSNTRGVLAREGFDYNFFGDQWWEVGSQLRPVDLGAGLVPEFISAGGQHVCAVLRQRRSSAERLVKCWGHNAHGQLGLGDSEDRGTYDVTMGAFLPRVDLGPPFVTYPPTPAPAVPRATVSAAGAADYSTESGLLLSVGLTSGCVARPGRMGLQCWGSDIDWFGRGGAPRAVNAPAMLDMGRGFAVQQIVQGGDKNVLWGGDNTCVLLQPGSVVKCWGSNWYEQLELDSSSANDNYQQRVTMALVPPDSRLEVSSLAAGQFHMCAILRPTGQVKCWGNNHGGRLGLGDEVGRGAAPGTDALPFVDLGTGLEAVALAAGDAHTCAILNPGGRVKCWGQNSWGQLGLGDTSSRGLHPDDMGDNLPFVDLGTNLSAVAIVAGAGHTCALLEPGRKVKCWGANNFGQLGLGDDVSRGQDISDMGDNLPFVDLGPGLDVIALASGPLAEHTCALLGPQSDLKCWGLDDYRQLGRGTGFIWHPEQPESPVGTTTGKMGSALASTMLSPDVVRVKAVSCSRYFTCAVVETFKLIEKVKCWGQLKAYFPEDVIQANPDKQVVYKPGLGALGDLSEDLVLSPLLGAPPAAALRTAPRSQSAPASSPAPPPWTYSCRVTLTRDLTSLHCWPNPDLPDLPPHLPAWVGRELRQALLSSPSPSSTHSGVSLHLRVPPADVLSYTEKELQQNTAGSAYQIPDMGVTFRGVPHLRIVDSAIRGFGERPNLQPLGPLLQCAGCAYLTIENVAVKNMNGEYTSFFREMPYGDTEGHQGITDPNVPLFGPIHASGLIGADVSHFTCSDVEDSQGWSCLHLQYNDLDDGVSDISSVPAELQQLYDTAAGNGFLTIRDSGFGGTKTSWGGAYGTSVHFSDELYVDYDFTRGSVLPDPIYRIAGYGAVVVSRLAAGAAAAPDAHRAPLVREARGALEIRLVDSSFNYNQASFGGVLAVLGSSRDYIELSGCNVNGAAAKDGAVLYVNGSLSGLTLRNTQLTSSIAARDGGIAFVRGSIDRLTVLTSQISGNSAASGGVVHAPYIGSINITDSLLADNTAVLYGGAIASHGLGSLSLTASLVSGHKALNGSGAVLHVLNGFNHMDLTAGSTISGNAARDTGGAVFSRARALEIRLSTGSAIKGNSAGLADGSDGGSFWGRGVMEFELVGKTAYVLTNSGVI